MKYRVRSYPEYCDCSKGQLAQFIQEVLAIAESDEGWNDLETARNILPGFFEEDNDE